MTPADALLAPGPPSLAQNLQADRAKPDVWRFLMLAIQLALLLVVFKVYALEQAGFFSLAWLTFGGFAVSYWLPFRFKQAFFILMSLAGAYVLLAPVVATLLIAAGLLLFAIIRSVLAFSWKVIVLLIILGCLAWARGSQSPPVLERFWPVFGAIFMFRMIVYLYDVRHLPGPVDLKEFLSYFFLLPNYYFIIFPVIDFQTFRRSFFKRDIHPVAQQGVWWILRGTTHLLLYRIVYQLQAIVTPPKVPVPVAVASQILLCYLLYLRVSGQFHIIVGMLHLFGYDLPETNRKYLLANSINDFWRRINIYWKEFMVKVVYFPLYFKLRKKGDLRAQLIAAVAVFAATWFLHAYQFFWLQGKFRVTLNDSLFWMALASLMIINIAIDYQTKRRPPKTGWVPKLQNALQIIGTLALISFLWSMWSAEGMTEWFYFLKTGKV